MLTLRNIGGVCLFLFGTTFMWLTPAFAGPGVDTHGFWWTTTQVLCLVTMAGFTVATWGLFGRHAWWEPVAFVSAVLGLLALVPYTVAAVSGGEASPWFNVFVHVAGSVGVLALLLVPSWERWVNVQVTRAGRLRPR